MRQTDQRERRGGFTLVEVLVVIGVLAALMGLLIPAVGALRRRSQSKSCKALLESLAGAIEQYASDFGDFPPTSLAGMAGVTRTNGTNEGSEALVRCLTTTLREGPYFDFEDDRLGNLDDDALAARANPTSSSIQVPALFEALDPWGNPLIYFHHRDYRGGKSLERYTIGEGLEEQRCRLKPADKTGQYPGFGRFVIWSAGPDGINEDGGGDDVCSWQ